MKWVYLNIVFFCSFCINLNSGQFGGRFPPSFPDNSPSYSRTYHHSSYSSSNNGGPPETVNYRYESVPSRNNFGNVERTQLNYNGIPVINQHNYGNEPIRPQPNGARNIYDIYSTPVENQNTFRNFYDSFNTKNTPAPFSADLLKDFYNNLGTKPIENPYTNAFYNSFLNRDGNKKCANSETVVNGKHTCRDQLIFEDYFEDLEQWDSEIKFAGSPDYEFVIYNTSRQNIFKTMNSLNIKPTLLTEELGEDFLHKELILKNCTGKPNTTDCHRTGESFQILPPIMSGRLTTKNKFSFKYGALEIRAKLPKGDWIYPELFLQPFLNKYGPEYDSGQIRIAFCHGNEKFNKVLQAGIILGDSYEARNHGMHLLMNTNESWADHFHNFGIIWTPDQIQLAVDGEIYATIKPPKNGFASELTNGDTNAAKKWAESGTLAPFDEEMYIVLGVGVGGHNFADIVPGKPWKNISPKNMLSFWQAKDSWYRTWNEYSSLQVMYVKIWSL